MKKFISAVICMISAILFIGILGGIECGEPISNAWMLLPTGFVCFISGGIYTLLD